MKNIKTKMNLIEELMKNWFFLCIVLQSFLLTSPAQATGFHYLSPQVMEGCFSDESDQLTSSSICLFADGSFYYPMLLNMTGNYDIEGNKIFFYPHQRDVFEVYGRYNPTLESGMVFNFTGFNLDSLINFDDTGYNYLPLKNSHCYWQPKVEIYPHPVSVQKFSLAYAPQADINSIQSMVSYEYQLPEKANDLLLIYHRPEMNGTNAIVLTDDQNMWLQMSKDTLSMQKIKMSYEKFQELKKISKQVRKTDGFPRFINQDNTLVMENIDNHLLDKITNRYYRVPTEEEIQQQALMKKKDKNYKPKAEYVKKYRRIKITGQSMHEVMIELRDGKQVVDTCF